MGFSRHEYWSGLPFPSPGDLPDSGIKYMSPALQADSLLSEPPGKHHILGGEVVKNLPANAGDLGSIPESGRSPGEGNSNPLQCSCLENPMNGGAQHAVVHGVAKSWTRLNYFTVPYVCLLS